MRVTERWLVAMSGGVDSSVAAAILARGADVVGLTMDLGGTEDAAAEPQLHRSGKMCCGLPDAEDARAVARTLGIRHYTANYRRAFRTAVIDPFVAEYDAGRTPIPCIACNRVLKFDLLVARARALGACGVATGHYARIAPGPDGAPALYRPRDRDKDQTYFLFDTPRATLAVLRFPLGDLTKAEVRGIAAELGLATAQKPESQGICFIPDGDVGRALERLRPAGRTPGAIRDGAGQVLGEHRGARGYTMGQRRGLGLADGPYYVTEVHPQMNELVVERREALLRGTLSVERATWMDDAPPPPDRDVRVQVRHKQTSRPARILPLSDDGFEVALEEPVWAPAAGQAAVVYDARDERVLGGGWIAGSV
jgi:tRNA-specific 2-thiouridylase